MISPLFGLRLGTIKPPRRKDSHTKLSELPSGVLFVRRYNGKGSPFIVRAQVPLSDELKRKLKTDMDTVVLDRDDIRSIQRDRREQANHSQEKLPPLAKLSLDLWQEFVDILIDIRGLKPSD